MSSNGGFSVASELKERGLGETPGDHEVTPGLVLGVFLICRALSFFLYAEKSQETRKNFKCNPKVRIYVTSNYGYLFYI